MRFTLIDAKHPGRMMSIYLELCWSNEVVDNILHDFAPELLDDPTLFKQVSDVGFFFEKGFGLYLHDSTLTLYDEARIEVILHSLPQGDCTYYDSIIAWKELLDHKLRLVLRLAGIGS